MKPTPPRIALPVLALAAVAATALAARVSPPSGPTFHNADWSLPIDPWGPGQAFTCTATACGHEVRLFARTKVGFCNCYNGVADDTEIDRIGDVDLHGEDFTPTSPGTDTSLGPLSGRARRFTLSLPLGQTRQVLSIVVATDCKAVIATLVSDEPITPQAEQAARTLLAGDPFQHWVANQ